MARYQIGKRFSFDAAHHLSDLPEGHKCRRVHGHTYSVEIILGADQLGPPGFVTDFGDLSLFGDYLRSELDHQNLNDVLDFPPTSEAIAEHLARWFIENVQPTIAGRLITVRVAETPTTWAQYTVDAVA